MDTTAALIRTRRALHGVAELVLAGPQHLVGDTVRLRVVPGGIATTVGDDVRLDGTTLRRGDVRVPVDGASPRDLAASLGLTARRLDDVYAEGTDVDLDETLHVDDAAAAALASAWSAGDAALRRLEPDQEPVLWPEHFDVGISAGQVNYGVSPGDSAIPTPYAYVGPWTPPPTDDFWDRPFGAARLVADLPDVEALLGFFQEARRRAG
jgi:hypothetical protein